MWLLFCKKEDNLTEHVWSECNHCSLFLIGGIQSVTTVQCYNYHWSPLHGTSSTLLCLLLVESTFRDFAGRTVADWSNIYGTAALCVCVPLHS